MIVPYEVDTKDARAVSAYARAMFVRLGWASSVPLVERVFQDVANMFAGKYPGYRGIDMRYHDFEHTLQATVCLLDIIDGRQRMGGTPALSARDGELAVMASLLHDAGFLKRSDDAGGTGAKYTMIHERRSCDFARGYLPSLGVTEEELDDVCAAISCTGPRNRIGEHVFRRPEARMMACILMTADYLAQMSASDYPAKLKVLYREFEESFDFERVPPEKRPYHGVRELFEKTPAFWTKFVQPMLENEADAVFRYLSKPGRTNPYLDAVEANMREIRRQLEEGLVHV
ncbi:MAG TPA: HD domain-containing protein [Candidatus Didemnitutus sp.]|nr:HD domain-containing protein [Candidatus Didemnitutus sp.]